MRFPTTRSPEGVAKDQGADCRSGRPRTAFERTSCQLFRPARRWAVTKSCLGVRAGCGGGRADLCHRLRTLGTRWLGGTHKRTGLTGNGPTYLARDTVPVALACISSAVLGDCQFSLSISGAPCRIGTAARFAEHLGDCMQSIRFWAASVRPRGWPWPRPEGALRSRGLEIAGDRIASGRALYP